MSKLEKIIGREQSILRRIESFIYNKSLKNGKFECLDGEGYLQKHSFEIGKFYFESIDEDGPNANGSEYRISYKGDIVLDFYSPYSLGQFPAPRPHIGTYKKGEWEWELVNMLLEELHPITISSQVFGEVTIRP